MQFIYCLTPTAKLGSLEKSQLLVLRQSKQQDPELIHDDAPATTHPNCSLSSLLLFYDLQGQCKRRVLFAAFAFCTAAFGV